MQELLPRSNFQPVHPWTCIAPCHLGNCSCVALPSHIHVGRMAPRHSVHPWTCVTPCRLGNCSCVALPSHIHVGRMAPRHTVHPWTCVTPCRPWHRDIPSIPGHKKRPASGPFFIIFVITIFIYGCILTTNLFRQVFTIRLLTITD